MSYQEKNNLEELFKEANSIVEVFGLVRKLKTEGEFSVEEINVAATARKKQLVKSSNVNSKIKKIRPAVSPESKNMFSSFKMSVQHPSKPTIEVLEDGTVVI